MMKGGRVDPAAWAAAARARETIGICRKCGGYLAPDDVVPDEPMRLRWFIARCLDCGQECAAPDGRVCRGSARLGERANEGRG